MSKTSIFYIMNEWSNCHSNIYFNENYITPFVHITLMITNGYMTQNITTLRSKCVFLLYC